jgi:drug/metabolite transporter (DMT)-like permease
MEVISKPFMETIDPFFLTFIRFLIGGSFLMLWVKKKVLLKDVISLSFIGFLNSGISMTLLQLSVKYGAASTAATLIATNPLFVMMFSPLINKEKLGIKKFIGFLIGLVGLLIFSREKIAEDTTFGILSGLGAGITFALYTTLMKKYVNRYDSITPTAYSMLLSSLIYGLFLIFCRKLEIPILTVSNLLFIGYAGIGVTGIAYFLFFKAVEKIGSISASRVFYLKPVIASILSMIILAEHPGIVKFIGMFMIILSMII